MKIRGKMELEKWQKSGRTEWNDDEKSTKTDKKTTKNRKKTVKNEEEKNN